jgi:branched-chain amino acid transport system substrate-binding protein
MNVQWRLTAAGRLRALSRRLRAASSAVLLAALLVSGASAGSALGAAETREILVGALLSLSEAGDPDTQAAVAIATSEINAYLGESGSDQRVRLVVEGTGYEPAVALEKLNAMAAQGIKVVVGPEGSGELSAVKGPAEQHGIVLVSHCSTAPSLAIPDDNVFRFVPDDSRQAEALARIMVDDGIKAIVPIWRGDIYGDDLTAATKASFSKLGGIVLEGIRFDPGAESFAAELRDLSARVEQATDRHGAQAVGVHLVTFGEQGAAILSGAQDLSALATVRWYGSEGTVQSREIAGDERAARFAIRVGLPNPLVAVPDTKKSELIKAKIRQRIGGEPHACALAAYDALWAVALTSLATGGTDDSAAFRRAFPRTAESYFGATGWTTLNAAGDRDAADYDLWSIRDRSGTFVWENVGRYVVDPSGGRLVQPAARQPAAQPVPPPATGALPPPVQVPRR